MLMRGQVCSRQTPDTWHESDVPWREIEQGLGSRGLPGTGHRKTPSRRWRLTSEQKYNRLCSTEQKAPMVDLIGQEI